MLVYISFILLPFSICIFYASSLLSKDNNSIKPGDVMTVCFAATMAISSFGMMAPNINAIQEACIAASDYFNLLDRKPQIYENESCFKLDRNKVKGRIEFKNINFIYPSDKSQRNILNDLNLICNPGQKVAIVGESGSGKSTIFNLIERLYEPISGKILLDGIDIKKYDLQYFRSLIGYVQQEPVLFNSSIKDNIIFGRQGLIKNEFQTDENTLVKKACIESYAKEFIDKIPEKYDYIVGIKGSKLSGGQKQRIAIARAILCNPKILILDEATSALDNKSEKNVQKALDNISNKNVTTIIIAHRLSTIINADIIYAIKNGKVLEKGTHDELLKLNGYYSGLVKTQIEQDDKNDIINNKKSSVYSLDSSKVKNDIVINEEYEIKKKQKEQENTKKLIPVKISRIFSLFRNRKMLVFLGSIASFLNGTVMPFAGFSLSYCINDFSSSDKNKIKKVGGILHGCIYIILGVTSSCFILVKIRNFKIIGSYLSCQMRKLIINKYLNMHMGFYDKEENSPGSLLAKLSLDTVQLNSLILFIIGDITQTIGCVIIGFLLGLIKDYRLMLISLCFMPFIIISSVVSDITNKEGKILIGKLI